MSCAIRHFLDLKEFSSEILRAILTDAKKMKVTTAKKGRFGFRPLEGKVLALIFDKPSTRTRVSFDLAMRELGGETILLSGQELQLGRGETIADTAQVLSRYVDAIMIRTTDHNRLLDLASAATVPVINGLTDDSHPCQIMADILTFEEHLGLIRDKKIAWSGDGNNVLTSFIHAAARFSFTLAIASPKGFEPESEIMQWSAQEGAQIVLTHDPFEAVSGADCVVTDTFVSMGDDQTHSRRELLMPYQVNDALMAAAASHAIFMHCLPAHREEEVTSSVMDGPQSVVFDEAENRLHAQKAILNWCMA